MAIIDELIAVLGYDIQGEGDLRKFNASLDGLEKKAYAVGAALGATARIAGTVVAAGFSFLGASVIGTSAKFETYLATLETIEGSSEKAQAAMDWVKDFARSTPYEVDELTAAFVKLRSYGLDPMDGSMTVMGDTAAGMGKSINQVVEAVADASTFQFERLRELGIVASQNGDKVSFAWTENGIAMSRTIDKTSTDINKFLTEVWGKKFGGAMIRQSKTWTGMMSNLSDSWTDFQVKIGEAGFFDVVKNKLGDLMDVIAEWQSNGTVEVIAKTLSDMFTSVADTIGWVAERISTHVGFIMDNFDKFKPYLTGVGIALAALGAWAFPVVAVFVGLGLAVDDFLTYLEGGESVIGSFIDWCSRLPQVLSDAAGAFGEWLSNVDWKALGANAGGLLADALVAAIVGYWAGTQAISEWIITSLTNVDWGQVWDVWNAGWTALFELMAGVFVGFGAKIIEYITGWFTKIDLGKIGSDMGGQFVNGLIAGIINGAAGVAMAISSIMPGAGGVGYDPKLVEMLGLDPAKYPGLGGTPPASTAPLTNPSGPGWKMLLDSYAGGLKPTDVTNTQTVNVNAPVTVQVQQASQAPGAVGAAVGAAVRTGAQPPRMNGGMN